MGHGPSKPNLHDTAHNMEEHFHSIGKCVPEAADPVQVTAGAGAWTEGTAVDILNSGAAATETDDFDLHWVVITDISAADDFELVIYGGGSEIDRVPFYRGASAPLTSIYLPVHMPIQDGSTAITVKLASGDGSNNCYVKFKYHTY